MNISAFSIKRVKRESTVLITTHILPCKQFLDIYYSRKHLLPLHTSNNITLSHLQWENWHLHRIQNIYDTLRHWRVCAFSFDVQWAKEHIPGAYHIWCNEVGKASLFHNLSRMNKIIVKVIVKHRFLLELISSFNEYSINCSGTLFSKPITLIAFKRLKWLYST